MRTKKRICRSISSLLAQFKNARKGQKFSNHLLIYYIGHKYSGPENFGTVLYNYEVLNEIQFSWYLR